MARQFVEKPELKVLLLEAGGDDDGSPEDKDYLTIDANEHYSITVKDGAVPSTTQGTTLATR